MDEPIDPASLRDSELFENQPPEVIRAVLAQGQLQELGPGDVVFRQGDQGDRLFVVKSGVRRGRRAGSSTRAGAPS